MKQKSLLIALIAILFFSIMPSSGFAQTDTPTMQDIEKYLLEQGFPQDYILILTDEQKKGFYRDGAKLISLDTVEGHLDEDGTITPEKIIKPNALKNWSATLSVTQVRSGRSGILKHRLNYNWKWNQRAMFTLKDKFGIAWSDDWDALPSTAVYSYTPRGINSAGKYSSRRFNYRGYRDYKPGNGIGWEYDIRRSFTGTDGKYYETSSHSGHGAVDVVKPHNGSGRADSSSAVGGYFHKRGAVTGSLGFNGSGKPSISISWSTQYNDSPQSGKQWYWYHRNY